MAGTPYLDEEELNAIVDAEDLPNTSPVIVVRSGDGGGRAGSYQQLSSSRRSCSVGDGFTTDHMLNAMFMAADEDGDGKLSRQELKDFFKPFRSIVEAPGVDEILDKFDADANGRLDMEEFEKFFTEKLQPVLQNLKLNKVLTLLDDIELNEKNKKLEEANPRHSAFSRCCSGRLKKCARRLHLQSLLTADPNGRTDDVLTRIGGYHDLTSKAGLRRFKNAVQDHLDEWARDKLEKHENERNRDGNATRNQGEIGVHDLNVQQLIDKAGKLGALSDDRAPKWERGWQKQLRDHADEIGDLKDSKKQEYKNQAIQLIQNYLLREQREKDKQLEDDLEQIMKKQKQQKEEGLKKRDGGCIKIVSALKGTVWWAVFTDGDTKIQRVVNSFQMVLSIAIYATIRLVIKYGRPWAAAAEDNYVDEEDLPPINNISVLGGFLSFFLVFFASQSYNRFEAMYRCSMSCEGRIFDTCSMAQACLSPGAARRLWRHINAAHALAYIGLTTTDQYSVASLLKPLQAQYCLLSDEEWCQFVTEHCKTTGGVIDGGSAYRELIACCVRDVESERQPRVEDAETWSCKRVRRWIVGDEKHSEKAPPLKLDCHYEFLRKEIADLFFSHRIDGAHLMRLVEEGSDTLSGKLEMICSELRDDPDLTVEELLLKMVENKSLSSEDDDERETYLADLHRGGFKGLEGMQCLYALAKQPPDVLRGVVSDLYRGRQDEVGSIYRREKLFVALSHNLGSALQPPRHRDAVRSINTNKLARNLRKSIQQMVWGENGKLSDMRADELVRHVLRLRGALGSLFDFKDQPVPFFYVHLLYLISTIYLPLFAYENALEWPETGSYMMGSYRSLDASGNNASGGANLVGPQVYVEEFQTEMWFATSAVGLAVIILQNMIVIGLTKICEMLADPYGTDEADLAVKHYVVFTLQMSRQILISIGSASASGGGGGGNGSSSDSDVDDDDDDDDDGSGGGGGGGGGGAMRLMETREFSREMETAETQMELRGAFGRLTRTLDAVGTRKGGGGINYLERLTGLDLDRDGDVGAQGTNQQTHEPGRRSLASHGSDSRAHASQLHMEFQEDVSAMEDQMQRRRRMSLARTQARLANRRVAAEIDAETHATDSTDTKGDDGPESEPGPELEPQAQQSSALTPQKLPV